MVIRVLLALFYACFSASSNLAYLGHGTGNMGYLVKHLCISVSFF
jgi:hypothetical protein